MAKTRDLRHARENANDRVPIRFGFTSDWLRRRREFSRPITERSEVNPIKAIQDYIGHSIENCPISDLLKGFVWF